MITTITINAKCSDLCAVDFCDEKGLVVGNRCGYVPKFMPGQHFGDYIILEIDVKTGKILNWKVPTQNEMIKSFDPK